MSTIRAFPKYLDGYYFTPRLISRRPRRYPFRGNGDIVSDAFDETFLIFESAFAPTAAGTAHADVAGYYLIDETPVEIVQGDLGTFRRTYAQVPTTQTAEDTQMVTRPTPGLASYPGVLGSYRIFKPDSSLESFDAYLAKSVTADTGAPAFYPTGGTYTLTFGGDTTGVLNYNDNAATIEAALDALTSVLNRGGVTVSGSYNSSGGLVITFNSYAAATAALGSLTGTSLGSYIGISNSGYVQIVEISGLSGVTGGTFTITVFGDTTAAIAYNATAADVKSALDALPSVVNRGNATVTVPNGQTTIRNSDGNIRFTISFANAAVTAAAGSLTPSGSTITPAIVDGGIGREQRVVFASSTAVRDLYSAAHGLSSTDTLFIKGGAVYYGSIAASKFSLPDANTIRLLIGSGDAYAAAGTITEVGKRTKSGYVPGEAPTLVDRVTRFSLSAITPDTYQGADANFLQQIFAGNIAINYRVGDSKRWPSEESPIRSLTTVKVSAANL